MHNFGKVHMYRFSAGPFGMTRKRRPCLILIKYAGSRGLIPTCILCPRSTQIHLSQDALKAGTAFVVPADIYTNDGYGYRFDEEGVFNLEYTQRVPRPDLHGGTYRGELPAPYLDQARQCDQRRRWWLKRKKT